MHFDTCGWQPWPGRTSLSDVADQGVFSTPHAFARPRSATDVHTTTSFIFGLGETKKGKLKANLEKQKALGGSAGTAEAGQPGQVDAGTEAQKPAQADAGKVKVPKGQKGPTRSRMECTSDGSCSCNEGHKCIQTWPPGTPRGAMKKLDLSKGIGALLGDEPQFALGCPVTRDGHDLISRNKFNKLNTECVSGRCMCVLNNDPDNGATTEVIKIPSATGEPKTLLPRFPMPNLDEEFVKQVTKQKKSDGTTVSPEPLFMDAMQWQQQFNGKYKKNMQVIIDYELKQLKKLEKEIDQQYKDWENDKTPDAKPGQKKSAGQLKEEKAQGDLEVRAAETFEEMHNYQNLCSKMEDTAQRFGLANFGEAKDLNCHLDPKERMEAFKAMDRLTELIQARTGLLDEPAKAASLIDAWTAAPLAALADGSRSACHAQAEAYRDVARSQRTREDYSSFLTSISL